MKIIEKGLRTTGEALYNPIPTEIPSVAGWKEIPLEESGEPLEAIGPFSGNEFDRLFTSSVYFGEHENSPYGRDTLRGALITTFVRQEVAQQLAAAEDTLPEGIHLIVLDTYRTLEVQQSLYDQYLDALKKQKPDWDENVLSEETQKYVSLPSNHPSRPSPHNTGGSVDVALYKLPEQIETRVREINVRISEIGQVESGWQEVYKLDMERIGLIAKNAELLNFGTHFDYGGREAALNHFEKLVGQRQLTPQEQEAAQSRRLLYNVMSATGLEPYADEWWHYNSKKSQMGAKTSGSPQAEYGAAKLSEDNWHHELTRRQHLSGTEVLSATPIPSLDKLGGQILYLEAAHSAAQTIGDIRNTSLPDAAVIAPPEEEAA